MADPVLPADEVARQRMVAHRPGRSVQAANAILLLADSHEALRATVARLRTAADDIADLEFNEGHFTAEDALRSVVDWLETEPRFRETSDGEVEHDLRLIADRLTALRDALDDTAGAPEPTRQPLWESGSGSPAAGAVPSPPAHARVERGFSE